MTHSRSAPRTQRNVVLSEPRSITWVERSALYRRHVTAVEPEDLVGVTEIAKRLGVHRDTVHAWKRRHDGSPSPIAEIEQVLVWNWPDVERWAKATGRLP